MIHNKDTFIKTISLNDKSVFIESESGALTFEINPWRVTTTYQFKCYIVVKLEGTDNPILIEFRTEQEALEALTPLQIAITQLKSTTDDIPQEIEDLIANGTGGDKHFKHIQAAPDTTWTVNHNLDKLPSVDILDDTMVVIIGAITHIDENNVIITFNQAVSGCAIFN